MIKLTTTQARAVASKIREKIQNFNDETRENLKKEFENSEEYQNQLKEVHEMCVTVLQTSLKCNCEFGVLYSRWSYNTITNEEELMTAEKKTMESLTRKYVIEHDKTKQVPDEDSLVTDLIFESLMCEDVQGLIDKFLEKYTTL